MSKILLLILFVTSCSFWKKSVPDEAARMPASLLSSEVLLDVDSSLKLMTVYQKGKKISTHPIQYDGTEYFYTISGSQVKEKFGRETKLCSKMGMEDYLNQCKITASETTPFCKDHASAKCFSCYNAGPSKGSSVAERKDQGKDMIIVYKDNSVIRADKSDWGSDVPCGDIRVKEDALAKVLTLVGENESVQVSIH